MNFHPEDYRVCRHCDRVSLVSDAGCRTCGPQASMRTLAEAAAPGGWAYAPWIIAGVICLLTLCPGPAFPIGGGVLIALWKMGSSQLEIKRKTREHRYVVAAGQLLKREATAQAGFAQGALERGVAAFEAGDFSTAAPALEEAFALGGRHPQLPLLRAVSLYNTRDYAAALPLLEALYASPEAPPMTPELLARSYLELGITTDAQASSLETLRRGLPEALSQRVTLALADYYLQPGPGHPDRGLFRAGGCEECGAPLAPDHRFCEGCGHPVPAPTAATRLHTLTEALTRAPDRADYVAALAAHSLAAGDAEKALQLCRSLPLDRHRPVSLPVYLQVLEARNDASAEAEAVCQAYLVHFPEDEDRRVTLAQLLVRRGDFPAAVGVLRAGLLPEAANLRLRYQLALIHVREGAVDAAIAELQALIRQGEFAAYRSRDDITRLLGQCLLRKGLYDAAYKQFTAIEPTEPTLKLLYELGEAFEGRREPEKARACWETIYAADLHFRDVSDRIG